jgi:hypothetical protein
MLEKYVHCKDRNGSGLYPMVGFGISGIQPSGTATRLLVS